MSSLAYEEMVDFIARINPQEVSGFHVSDSTKERVAELIAREKTDGLSTEETSELDGYMQLEHVMRLAKARAKQMLAAE